MNRLLFLIFGEQLRSLGRTLRGIDADNKGAEDIIGVMAEQGGQAMTAYGTGNLTGFRSYLKAAADGIFTYLASLTSGGAGSAAQGAAATGANRFIFLLFGEQLRGLGFTLRHLDPDNQGAEDVIGIVAEQGGQAMTAYGRGDLRGFNSYLRAVAEGIYRFLELPLPGEESGATSTGATGDMSGLKLRPQGEGA